jgi:hypothetical protein
LALILLCFSFYKMTEPFILYPTGMIGDISMNPGLPMVGASQRAPRVTELLPGLVFTGLGVGRYDVTQISGIKGAIDLWITTGATGSSRSLVVLADALVSPTRFLEIYLTTDNQAIVHQRSAAGVLIAAGQFAAEVAGAQMRLRYSWNSEQAIDGARFAKFRQSETATTTWGTDPTATWASFQPSYVFVGVGGIATGSDFNGTFHKVQIGNQVLV